MGELILCAILTFTAAGAAAAPKGAQDKDADCKADVEKFCKDVPLGEGRVAQCLNGHEAGLSEPCRKRVAQRRERRQKLKVDMEKALQACRVDLDKHCRSTRKNARRLDCLGSHEAELTPLCKDFADRLIERRQERRDLAEKAKTDCKPEIEKLCAGIHPGDGRILRCLQADATKLSPACKTALEPEKAAAAPEAPAAPEKKTETGKK
ncbi:MAG: hypothetical protein A2X36_02635 [Elusimicrobia bacterium GWA2_69_24]|nr:MAG: hypothetical protein A2X36_02635 [Elusimicrobia bacterium GWA2_69_24]